MIRAGKLKLSKLGLLGSLCIAICCVFVPTALIPAAFAQDVEIGTKSRPQVARDTDPMFIDIVLPRHQVYLGETIRVQYDVYVAQSKGLVQYDAVEPNFEAWSVLETPAPKPTLATLDGKHFTKEPFAIYYLNATRLGQNPLPKLAVEMPFTNPPRWISSPELFVEVILPPLPSPKDFSPHNIGAIEVELKNSEARTIRVGDVLNFELIITANAPSQNIVFALAQSAQVKEAFLIHEPYPIASKAEIIDDNYRSETRYRIRVSPLKEGQWPWPQFELSFFNPKTQNYELARTQAATLNVLPAKLNSTEASDGIHNKAPQRELRALELQSEGEKDIPSLAIGLIPLLFVVFGLFLAGLCEHRKRQRPWRQLKLGFQRFKKDFIADENAETQLIDLQDHLGVLFDLEPNAPSAAIVNQILKADIPKRDIDTLIQTIEELRQAVYSDKRPIEREKAETIIFIVEQMLNRKEEGK